VTASSRPRPAEHRTVTARRAAPRWPGAVDDITRRGRGRACLGHEQEPEPAGERPVLGGPGGLVTQTGQQVAGQRVIDHGEGGHPAHPTWVRGAFACHCGVASGIMAWTWSASSPTGSPTSGPTRGSRRSLRANSDPGPTPASFPDRPAIGRSTAHGVVRSRTATDSDIELSAKVRNAGGSVRSRGAVHTVVGLWRHGALPRSCHAAARRRPRIRTASLTVAARPHRKQTP
jgi:hypothetical protein